MEYAKPQISLLSVGLAEIKRLGKMPYYPVDNSPNSIRLTVPTYEADDSPE